MAEILTHDVYRVRYAVGGAVQPPVLVHAASLDGADRAVLLHAAARPDYDGAPVRVLTVEQLTAAG